MKILHTADWHLGHLFFGIDRHWEQQQFLHWLTNTLVLEQVDVLLISGDVFDVPNPSNITVTMFYQFLKDTQAALPNIQIIITAGNHDSALGLERPIPLLDSTKVHIIGALRKKEDGTMDYSSIIKPIKNNKNETELLCMAIPFLRIGDYPNHIKNYVDGVQHIYKECYATLANEKVGIIAMGHLHTAGIADNEGDDTDKNIIIGGQEKVAANCFDDNIIYTALGHIHMHQRIAGKTNIRYSGSPLAMSFAEHNYKHVVLLTEISNNTLNTITPIEVPAIIPLQKLSKNPVTLDTALELIAALPVWDATSIKPYVEIKIVVDAPLPTMRKQIGDALQNKNVQLADIKTSSNKSKGEINNSTTELTALNTLQPINILQQLYKQEYNTTLPQEIVEIFANIYLETQNQESN